MGEAGYTQLHTHLWVAALCSAAMGHVSGEAVVDGFRSAQCCLASLWHHTTIRGQKVTVTFTCKWKGRHTVGGRKSFKKECSWWEWMGFIQAQVWCCNGKCFHMAYKHMYALECLQEVASVPCHLSSLVMAACLLGWHHMLLIGEYDATKPDITNIHMAKLWYMHGGMWKSGSVHISLWLRETLRIDTGPPPVSLTARVWGTKTNRRMRKWMTGWDDAWESWMANGDHIVMNAVHTVVDARCLHWCGSSEQGGGEGWRVWILGLLQIKVSWCCLVSFIENINWIIMFGGFFQQCSWRDDNLSDERSRLNDHNINNMMNCHKCTHIQREWRLWRWLTFPLVPPWGYHCDFDWTSKHLLDQIRYICYNHSCPPCQD